MSDEEELTTGPRERARRYRLGPLRLDLLAGAGILAAVLVVGRAMSRDGAPAHTSPPTPTPSISAPIGGFGTGAPDPGSGLLNGASTLTATFAVPASRIVLRPRPIPTVETPTGDPRS